MVPPLSGSVQEIRRRAQYQAEMSEQPHTSEFSGGPVVAFCRAFVLRVGIGAAAVIRPEPA
jgi:hypothetical protein